MLVLSIARQIALKKRISDFNIVGIIAGKHFFFPGETIGFFLLPGCPHHLALCRVQEYINNSQNILKTITVWKTVCMLRIESYS